MPTDEQIAKAKAAQLLKEQMFLPQSIQPSKETKERIIGQYLPEQVNPLVEPAQEDMLEPIMKDLYVPYSTGAKEEPFISAREIERQRINKLASLAKNQPKPDDNFITRGARKLFGIQPPTLQERIKEAKEDIMEGATKSIEEKIANPLNREFGVDYRKHMGINYIKPSVLEQQEIFSEHPDLYGRTATVDLPRVDSQQKPILDAQGFPMTIPPHVYLSPALTEREKKATEFHEFGHADAPNLDKEIHKVDNRGQTQIIKYPGIFRDTDLTDAIGIIRHPDKDLNKQIVHDYYDSASEYLTRYFTPLKFQAASKYGIVPTTSEEAEKIIDKIRFDKKFQQKAAEEIYDYNKFDDALDTVYKRKFKRTPTLQEQQEYKRNWIEDFKKNLKDLDPTNKNLQKALIYVSKADTGSENA